MDKSEAPALIQGSAFVCAVLLINYAVWVTGGTHPAWQQPFLPLTLILLICTGLLAQLNTKTSSRNIWKDPVLYGGLFFTGLLLIQWLNGGRELMIDWSTGAWIYTAPTVSWLPAAIEQRDGFEMLNWFAPAWALALYIRHGIVSRRRLHALILWILIPAGVLALLSCGQFLIARLWGVCPSPVESYFVTSFGYANHAGAYFNLMFAVGTGLLLDRIYLKLGRVNTVILATVSIGCFLAANITQGRAAMLLSWFLVLMLVLYTWLARFRHLNPGQRFSRAVGVTSAVIFLFLLLFGVAESEIKREFTGHSATSTMEISGRLVKSAGFGERSLQRVVAAGIARDHFWFGAGGWAQRYLGFQYVDQAEWAHLTHEGDANTHHDTLQFLSEFGVFGLAMIILVVITLAAPLARHIRQLMTVPGLIFPALGVLLIYLYSFMDLPFRSPGILFSWTAILTWTSVRCENRISNADP